MVIGKRVWGGVTVIALDGALRGPDVRGQLRELGPADGPVLIDLSRTSAISSAGLRVLLTVYRQARAMGARLALTGPPPDVRQVMSATGFLDLFIVADTVEDGVAALDGN